MPPSSAAQHGDFSSLFTFLPIGAYRTDPDGTMLRVNPAFVALAGYDDEAQMLADMNLSDEGWYVVAHRRAEFRRLLDRDGFVRGFVSEVQRFDSGQTLWVSENAHLVRGADGRPLYYEGTVEDVSDRVLDQQQLRQSEERLRLTTDQVPGMVFSLLLRHDGRREYRFVSSGVREIYGFGPDDLSVKVSDLLVATADQSDDMVDRAVEAIISATAPPRESTSSSRSSTRTGFRFG